MTDTLTIYDFMEELMQTLLESGVRFEDMEQWLVYSAVERWPGSDLSNLRGIASDLWVVAHGGGGWRPPGRPKAGR